jgi:hypothetical protein
MRYSTATVLALASAAGLASAYPSVNDIYARDIDVTDLYARDIYDDIYARDAYAQEDPAGGAGGAGGTADPAGTTDPTGPPGPTGAGEPLPPQLPETAAAKPRKHHKKQKKHKHKNHKHRHHKNKNKRAAAILPPAVRRDLYDMDLETRDVYDADLSARDLYEREALLGLGKLWRKIRGKKSKASSADGDPSANGQGEGAPQRRDLFERDAEAELEDLYERELLELDRRWRWGSRWPTSSYSKTVGPSGSSTVKTSGTGNVGITASSTVVNADGVQGRDLYERDAEADYEFEELYARDPEADWDAVDLY